MHSLYRGHPCKFVWHSARHGRRAKSRRAAANQPQAARQAAARCRACMHDDGLCLSLSCFSDC